MFYPESHSEELIDDGTEPSKELNTDPNESSDETQGAGEPSDDKDSTKVDLSKVAPEVQEYIKSREKEMQASYTKKTQELSDERKRLEVRQIALDSKVAQMLEAKKPEEKLIDLDGMTADQRQAYELLRKDRQRDITKAVEETNKAWNVKYNQSLQVLGNLQWDTFADKNPGAEKYRSRMLEISKEPGHENLSLKSLYKLARPDDVVKQSGVEEYKQRVQTKKEAVTQRPTSASGQEGGIKFERGKREDNLQKAYDAAKSALDIK